MGLIEGDHFDDGQCLALLGRTQFGRVGLSIGAVPAVVPIRYDLQPDGIVLACSVDQVAKALERAIVALQSDGFDEDVQKRWTVLAVGLTERLEPPGPAERGPSSPRREERDRFWSASHFFRLRPEVFSGRWLDPI